MVQLDRVAPIASTIAAVAGSDPDRIAVEWSGGGLTYGQLIGWAARIREDLRESGHGPADHVAIATRRTPGAVAAMIAVLSAGGVIVPIDRALPAARREVMLDRSRATHLIAVGEDPLQGRLPGLSIGERPDVDHDLELRLTPREPQDPAYLFFTSGTTGVPKGVVGTHLGLAQFMEWMSTTLDVGESDRVSLVRSLSFDASLREVFLPLSVGATLVIAPDPLHPDEALRWLARRRITVLNATPSHAAVWLDSPVEAGASELRWACFSGERLDPRLVERWRATVSSTAPVANLYGPTETTMIRTFDVVADPVTDDILPVGHPLPHTRIHVVDSDGRRCSVGEPGEVWIATDVGTLGYLDGEAPDRFVPEPENPEAVAYRTGDRGWLLDDGRLVVSGRLDDQVQILGVRIEPGEVAALLATAPGVDRAEVVAVPDDRTGHRLVAFVRPSGVSRPDPSVWREHLVDRVLGPALPSRYVVIDAIPLTSNGKVDRDALLALLDAESPDAEPVGVSTDERVAALSPAKRALLEARLSGSPARPRSTEDRLAALSPTKRALLEARMRASGTTAVQSEPEAVREAPTSFAQERLWFLDRLYPGRANYNIVQVNRLEGAVDVDALRAGFDAIDRRHEALRTRYEERDGTLFQVVEPSSGAPFRFVDLSGQDHAEEAAERLAADEAGRVFDLATGPVWQATIVRISEESHLLVVVTHHIATDGWSMPPLYRELSAVYRAEVTDTDLALPELPIQYADYSVRQRCHADEGGYEADLAFWEAELTGGPDLVTLPSKRPRPNVQANRGARRRFEWPGVDTDRMSELARSHSATNFMVGLAIFEAFVAAETGHEDIVVGIPSADRVSGDTQDLIGFFVNSLAMRTAVPAGSTFRDVLGRVRDTAVKAYDHREVPFEHVVRRVKPQRSTDRSPIFQLFFQFGLGAFSAAPDLPGVVAERVERDTQASKFDLTLYLGLDDGVLTGTVVYDTDLFDPAEIDGLFDRFGRFAARVLDDPDEVIHTPGARNSLVEAPPIPRTSGAPSLEDVALAERIAGIWSEIFERPVGLDDDFFDLGGHSLLAIRVFSRVESELGRALPVGSIFEHPTPRGLAVVASAPAAGATPAEAPTRAELSFAQRRLWFLHRLTPDAGNYHVLWRVRFHGPLDLDALRQAFDGVAERHAVFRTRIVEEAGVPWQVIDRRADVPFDVTDLGPADELSEALAEESRRPFDLSAEHPIRVGVLRVAPDDHVVSVVAHHIATDAESMAILKREVRELYTARLEQRSADLAELPIQYVDFAEEQRRRFDKGNSALDAWVAGLESVPKVFELPPDRVRSSEGHDAGVVRAVLPEEITEKVLELARATRSTPFMVLLAAFGALLHRFSGEEDFLVGIPSTERTTLETERLIGFFVNSLPIRIDAGEEPSFREMLDRVRGRVLTALEHRDVPFEMIVDQLDVPRDPSRSPLLQVMFDMNQATGGAFSLPGVEVIPVGASVKGRPAKFDLRLHCRLAGSSLHTLLEYRTDLYDPDSMAVLSERFSALLEGAVGRPDLPIGQIPMMVEADTVAAAADARCAWPVPVGLIERFRDVAHRHAREVAIDDGRRKVTYAELARAARRIGADLRRQGVAPGATVGIAMPRSAGLVAAVLGTLEAGAAYVPLDPDYPSDRLEVIRADAGLSAIIRPGARGMLSVAIEAQPEGRPMFDPADRIAYVMFTSGSTGRPKGVLVPERAISRLVVDADYVRLEPGDVMAFASNTAFDAATFEVWGALLNGMRLRVLDRDTLGSPGRLAAEVERSGITTMFLTTALFNAVVAHKPDAFGSLRHLLVGGEAADVTAMRRCLEFGPPEHLLNAYGPTETTTFATTHHVTEVPDSSRAVPIGRPISGTSVRILDRNGEPVPIGVPGELVIGGPGVALGYLGDDELTSRRFVPGPDGTLEYRTGDRVRRRADGAIEFLGRMDRQIKMRGFRIEPGEIEAHLGAHSAVAESAVIPWEDAHGLRLAAYAVVRRAVESTELLDHLARRIPQFMVPTSLQVVEALPRTPNGKLDVGALPAPAAPSAPFVAPSGPAMVRMAALWEEVLETERVGAHDDFFALGGNSLLAIRLFAAMEREFGTSAPLSTLFEAPTVAALAARITGEPAAADSAPVDGVVTLRTGGSGATPLFCLPPAGGYVFVYEPVARSFDGDRPIYGVLSPGVDGREDPLYSVDDLAEYCLDRIVETQPDGPYLLLGYSLGGLIAWEVGRRLVEQGREVAFLGLVDSRYGDRLSLLGTLRRNVRLVRRHGRRGARAAWRATAANARIRAGNLRYGPATWYARVMGRPLPPLLAGRRITAAGREATFAFQPEPYPGPVVYFRANPLMGSPSRRAVESWRPAAGGGLELVDVPGDHKGAASVMHEPNAAVLAKEIQRLLERDVADD